MGQGKLTDEVHEELLKWIKAGNFVTVAARSVGISPSTFWNWMRRGRKARSGKYRRFYEDVRRAEAFAEMRAVGLFHKGMQSNWRAAVAYLERKFPKRWTIRKEGSGPGSARGRRKPTVVRNDYDDEFLAEVASVLDGVGAFESVAAGGARSPADQRDSASSHRDSGGVSRSRRS